MSLNSVNAGGYLNHTLGSVNGKLGLSYYRPSSYELFENTPNFHSDILNYRLQLNWQNEIIFNVIETKFSQFGDERDRGLGGSAVHSEGNLAQFYYAVKLHLESNGLETGIGAALRGKDANTDRN